MNVDSSQWNRVKVLALDVVLAGCYWTVAAFVLIRFGVLVVAGITIALAIYGFNTALAGRPVFKPVSEHSPV